MKLFLRQRYSAGNTPTFSIITERSQDGYSSTWLGGAMTWTSPINVSLEGRFWAEDSPRQLLLPKIVATTALAVLYTTPRSAYPSLCASQGSHSLVGFTAPLACVLLTETPNKQNTLCAAIYHSRAYQIYCMGGDAARHCWVLLHAVQELFLQQGMAVYINKPEHHHVMDTAAYITAQDTI